jgi:hypothetical protein
VGGIICMEVSMTKVYMYSMFTGEGPWRIGARSRLQGGPEIGLTLEHPMSVSDFTTRLLDHDLTGDLHTEVFGPMYALVREKVRELTAGAEQAVLFWRVPPTLIGGAGGKVQVFCIFYLWSGAASEIHDQDHKNLALAAPFEWEGYNDIGSGSTHVTEV